MSYEKKLNVQVMPAQLPSGISTPGATTINGGTSGERISTYAFDAATEEFLDVPVIINNYVSGDLIVGLPVISSPAPASSPPSFRSGNATNTKTVNKPSGTAEGDLLILTLQSQNASDPSAWPSGFTQISGGPTGDRVAIKIAGASEPSSYTITSSGSGSVIVSLDAISGVDTTTPINVQGVVGDSYTSPSVTTTVDNCLLYFIAFTQSGSSPTVPSGTTRRRGDQAYVGEDIYDISTATKTLATAGASGTGVWSGGDNTPYYLWTLAIAPAPSSGDPSYTGDTTLKVSPRVVTTDLSVTFNYATNAVTALKSIGLGCNVEEITIPAASLTGLAASKLLNLRISRTSTSNTLSGDLHLLPQLISVRQ